MATRENEEIIEYLERPMRMHENLIKDAREIEIMRSAMEYRSPSFDGVGGQRSEKDVSYSIMLAKEQEHENRKVEFAKTRAEVKGVIRSLKNPNERNVMEYRYLLYDHDKRKVTQKKWEEIAEIMNYDLRHVGRLHGSALEKIKAVLKCR